MISCKTIFDYWRDNACLEGAWKECGFHGVHFAASTMMVAMIDSIESKIIEND